MPSRFELSASTADPGSALVQNIEIDPESFAVNGLYSWHQIHSGVNGTFSVNTSMDGGVAARVAGWAKEEDPWVHIYSQFE